MMTGAAGAARTSICTSDAESITVRGHDLTRDLMGYRTFTESFFLSVTTALPTALPTAVQREFLDVLLISIAEQGLTLAAERGVSGPHCALAVVLGAAVPEARGKPLTMNVPMAIAAVLLDLDFPAVMIKDIPRLARTAGRLGHLGEEQQYPIEFLLAGTAAESIEYVGEEDAT